MKLKPERDTTHPWQQGNRTQRPTAGESVERRGPEPAGGGPGGIDPQDPQPHCWESTHGLGHEHSQQLSSPSPQTGNRDIPQSHWASHTGEYPWGTRDQTPARALECREAHTHACTHTHTVWEGSWRQWSAEVPPHICPHVCLPREAGRGCRAKRGVGAPRGSVWLFWPARDGDGSQSLDRKGDRAWIILQVCFFKVPFQELEKPRRPKGYSVQLQTKHLIWILLSIN